MMMPDLDGYGVLKQLRQNPSTRTLPFIFLTAKAAKVDQRQGMELGAEDLKTWEILGNCHEKPLNYRS